MYYANGGPAHYAEERAERLEIAQEKASERATNYHERSNQMASIIPFGQPMMPGHHSYKADLSYRKRIWKLMDKFCEEYKKAEWLGDKAEDSKRHQERKKSAMAMSNRLEKLEKELERIRRNLQASVKNSREENAQECRRMMNILACEIIPLKYALKDMGGTPFDKLEKPLQPGDYIRGRHGAGWVIRVNKTTITMWSWSGDRKWEYKCKNSDFIALLATAEQIAENEKKQEA
jgi:predicted RNase H-like nuclease (RuvC/YqgF family)